MEFTMENALHPLLELNCLTQSTSSQEHYFVTFVTYAYLFKLMGKT